MIENIYKQLLESTSGLKATPSFSTGPFPAIAYKVTPIQGGTVRKDQLEVRIMGKEFDSLAQIRDNIINQLDMEQSKPSIQLGNYVLRSNLAGGGWLFNTETQMWELYPIFTTTWRCKDEQ